MFKIHLRIVRKQKENDQRDKMSDLETGLNTCWLTFNPHTGNRVPAAELERAGPERIRRSGSGRFL